MKTLLSGRIGSAEEIVSALPEPDYEHNFQPTYSNRDYLVQTVGELLVTGAVTTPAQINAITKDLALASQRGHERPIMITDSCSESVSLRADFNAMVGNVIMSRSLVLGIYGNAIYFGRNRGQNTKPRSSQFQVLSNGVIVPSYYGDAVNGYDPSDREPDPSRMVAAASQANAIEAHTQRRLGIHVPAAHEALLLPYEFSFVSARGGKRYLLSADLPWLGKRTNDPKGPHVQFLATVENPIGAKIGDNSDANHISELARILNPNRRPGRLLFMLRLGNNVKAMDEIVKGINKYAPDSDILYDMHGTTDQLPDGTKIRAVPTIVDDIVLLATVCAKYGRALKGLHLETHTDNSRYECVDEVGQRPAHKSIVDPGLNPNQTRRVLHKTAHLFAGTN